MAELGGAVTNLQRLARTAALWNAGARWCANPRIPGRRARGLTRSDLL